MSNSVSESLDEVFNKHQSLAYARAEKESARAEKESARRKFLIRFDEVAQNLILKTANEFSAELAKRGHELKIEVASTANPSPQSFGGVFIKFLPEKRDFGSGCSPTMSFTPCENSDQVQIHAMCLEPGRSGEEINLNSYSLEKITGELIHEKLLKLIDGGLTVASHARIR